MLIRPTTPRSRIIAVLLAATVLIGGANLAAYATNGQPLLLGKTNVETKKATVKNTGSGPALHLKTRVGQPPLVVNRSKKVTKLNADYVDGANASDLESLVYIFELPSSPSAASHQIAFPGLPAGLYLMNYTVLSTGADATCYTENRTQGLSFSVNGGFESVNSGAAVLDNTRRPDLLNCVGDGGHIALGSSIGALSEVTFTRLDDAWDSTPVISR